MTRPMSATVRKQFFEYSETTATASPIATPATSEKLTMSQGLGSVGLLGAVTSCVISNGFANGDKSSRNSRDFAWYEAAAAAISADRRRIFSLRSRTSR